MLGRRDDPLSVDWAADFAAELKTAEHAVHYAETVQDDHGSLGGPATSTLAAAAVLAALTQW
jgi:hypothetical protein